MESLSEYQPQRLYDMNGGQRYPPSIRFHRWTLVALPDFQPMRVSEELVCIYLFRQNPVFTSLHLRYPVHVEPPWEISNAEAVDMNGRFQMQGGKNRILPK
jgi:hypothetical protein